MSYGTGLYLDFDLPTITLGELCILFNQASPKLEEIWFGARDHICDGFKERSDILFANAPFWDRKLIPWEWWISIGQSDSAVGMAIDEEGEWPELASSYGFPITVFRDAVEVYVPAKWGYVLARPSIQEALLETTKVMRAILSGSHSLIVALTSGPDGIVEGGLQDGCRFHDVLNHLHREYGVGRKCFCCLTNEGDEYLEI